MSAVARWNNCQPGWHESSLGVGKKKKKWFFHAPPTRKSIKWLNTRTPLEFSIPRQMWKWIYRGAHEGQRWKRVLYYRRNTVERIVVLETKIIPAAKFFEIFHYDYDFVCSTTGKTIFFFLNKLKRLCFFFFQTLQRFKNLKKKSRDSRGQQQQ